jgi:hypothetical protein
MRLLIAGAAAAAMLCGRAQAQVVTISPAELVQLGNQLTQLKQEYTATLGIFGSLVRQLDPNTYAQQLLAAANPMPEVGQITQMVSGFTGTGGGGLAGMAGQFLRNNTYYMPQSTGAGDFNALALQRQASTLSNAQALAQQALSSLQTHIAGISDIQEQLSSATSQADLAAINGRLQAEQANLAAQGVQAQALNALVQAQQQQYQQMAMQRLRQEADDLAISVGGTAATGGLPTPPAPAQQIPTFTGG